MKMLTKAIAAVMLMTAAMFVAGCNPEDEPINGGETIYTIEVLANPSGYGVVIGGGSYHQGDSCTVIATANEGYTFVNWTENGSQISKTQSYTFIITGDRSLIANFDHEYVDLGLPNGTLWATCNLSATTPEGYGDYFAWGEPQPKNTYNWSTYKYANGDYDQLTKYCNDSYYGYNGHTDTLTILLPEDDAAIANWGDGWCMPTADQWRELRDNTNNTWTTQNGVNGMLFTASNGNSLFLPAAGGRWDDELGFVGEEGYYWSRLLDSDHPDAGWGFLFNSRYYGMHIYNRFLGLSVRAVRSSRQN